MSKYGPRSYWECTDGCKSFEHSRKLNAAITKRCLTDEQIASYLRETCCNFAKVQDNYGRTTLHVAASCGRLDLCVWLVAVAGADVNAKDWESGYTPLQRSIFYGNINVAVRLIQLGADFSLFDKEDLSALELLSLQRLPEVRILANIPSQVYVWGSNLNFTLGSGTDDMKKTPELLEYFKKNNISVKQICTDEFHSVFVSSFGDVWVCGHGRGGRLSTCKKPLLIPTFVSLSNEECVTASIAVNHTLLLLSNGSVMAFGSNNHHQLGVTPHTDTCLSPKHVNLNASRPFGPITGICAAKFHSIFYNENTILVCGLNAGQLGSKTESPFITVPQQISGKDKFSAKIKSVATSVGSVVYSLNNGDVFIVHRYQLKKIASKIMGVEKIVAFGGHLSSTTISEITDDLKILILTSKGSLIFWEENTPHLMKCSFGMKKSIVVNDVFLNESSILFTTADGEAYEGFVKDRDSLKKSPDDDKKRNSGGIFKDEKIIKHGKLNKCLISTKRIQHIHRALSITSDPKGKNFAVIQAHPNNTVDVTLSRSKSEVQENMKMLLLEASEDDSVHDIVFNLKGTRIAAHRYILAVNGFPTNILENSTNGDLLEISIGDNTNSETFKEFLLFLYTGNCSYLNSDFHNKNKDDLLQSLSDLANKYKIPSLIHRLHLLGKYDIEKSPNEPCEMHRSSYPEYYDVELRSDNNKLFKAHKCVLAARLPYFNSMFLRGWSETSKSSVINLATSALIAEAFLDFLYDDEIPASINCDELDNMIRLLILSDQLLFTELKESCEIVLAKSINLKNCVSILQVCEMYNTSRLKEPVINFIIQNLNAVLESRILESLDSKTLLKLTEHYKRHTRYCAERVITPDCDAPSDSEVLDVVKPVLSHSEPFFISPEEIKNIISNKNTKLNNTPIFKKKVTKKNSFHNIAPIEDKVPTASEISDKPLSRQVPEGVCSDHKYQDKNIQFFDESDFPSLSESPDQFSNYSNKQSSFLSRSSLVPRIILPHPSQKQKKKKSLVDEELTVSPPKTIFKGWAAIPPIIETSVVNSDYKKAEPNLLEIISNEQKQKHNFHKMKSKLFHLTQMEDAAMDELITFYNADNIFDERITVERVVTQNIARPVWIPGQKKKAYEEF